MRKFRITNVQIEETYGGVLALESYKWWNEKHINAIDEKVEKHFGSERKIWKDTVHLDLNTRLPQYFFIAWLADENVHNMADDEDDECHSLVLFVNEHSLTDDEDDEYHGFHLFVVGYTEDINDVLRRINEIGDEKFDIESVGFYY